MIRRFLAVGFAIAVLATASGCSPAANSPSPVATVKPSLSPRPPTRAPASSASPAKPSSTSASARSPAPGSGATGTTTINWGVIWDAIPADFPRYPGSSPTVTGGGPASAVLDIPAETGAASTWFQAAVVAAGFQVTGANGPREDGSYEVTASKGDDGCQAEITLAPLGASTTATIYLAAACPFS